MVAALAAAALLPKRLVVDADLAVVPPVVVVDDRRVVVVFAVSGAAAPVPRRGAPYCLVAYNAVRTILCYPYVETLARWTTGDEIPFGIDD